jgi:hypothetical protein
VQRRDFLLKHSSEENNEVILRCSTVTHSDVKCMNQNL